jgi:hypothetical protein
MSPLAVTMVLQNLLFESLPESLVDPETARIGKTIRLPSSKCSTRASMKSWVGWLVKHVRKSQRI